ncbi:Trans-resveratrol di-O-methyltransferase [Acorus gramineus]|uniref:Trans-resveratrol di-O-methyltransferase n=1 Tax=Acorus gramineus TaxID=55184 RepID=A0AAV9BIS1_ACOGR|nr:Trans-resveratrol di-O-methyltransferase [Acorus gramineus]
MKNCMPRASFGTTFPVHNLHVPQIRGRTPHPRHPPRPRTAHVPLRPRRKTRHPSRKGRLPPPPLARPRLLWMRWKRGGGVVSPDPLFAPPREGQRHGDLAVPACDARLGPAHPWQSLGVWFHTDVRTPILKAHEMELWGLTGKSEGLNRMFNEAMACDSRLVSKWLVEKQRQAFVGLKSLVDVGGGTGGLTLTIAEAFPWIKCTVFDLPHVVADAPEGTLVNFEGGNMFEYIPPSDAVIFKLIMHDWSDEECVKILKQCKKAIPTKEEGGKVMILDMVVNSKIHDHKATETQFFFDMLMMVLTGGREREELEWEKMFMEAGFHGGYKATHGSGVLSLIEVYP